MHKWYPWEPKFEESNRQQEKVILSASFAAPSWYMHVSVLYFYPCNHGFHAQIRQKIKKHTAHCTLTLCWSLVPPIMGVTAQSMIFRSQFSRTQQETCICYFDIDKGNKWHVIAEVLLPKHLEQVKLFGSTQFQWLHTSNHWLILSSSCKGYG